MQFFGDWWFAFLTPIIFGVVILFIQMADFRAAKITLKILVAYVWGVSFLWAVNSDYSISNRVIGFLIATGLLILLSIFAHKYVNNKEPKALPTKIPPIKKDVEIRFREDELFVSTPYNNVTDSNDKIIQFLVQNTGDETLNLRADVDLESRPFKRAQLTIDEKKEQTNFTLYSGDKKYVNLLEWRTNKPNEIKFSAPIEYRKKATINLELNEKVVMVFMVLGNEIKRHDERFHLWITENGPQLEKISGD